MSCGHRPYRVVAVPIAWLIVAAHNPVVPRCVPYFLSLFRGTNDRLCCCPPTTVSLMGNKGDLSHSGGAIAATPSSTATDDDASGMAASLLVDDRRAAVAALLASSTHASPSPATSTSVAVVLDNCGLELLCDLCFVDAVLRLTPASCVTLHCKDTPVFVSDVIEPDVELTLAWLETAYRDRCCRRRVTIVVVWLCGCMDVRVWCVCTALLPSHDSCGGGGRHTHTHSDAHTYTHSAWQAVVAVFWRTCLYDAPYLGCCGLRAVMATTLSQQRWQLGCAAGCPMVG